MMMAELQDDLVPSPPYLRTFARGEVSVPVGRTSAPPERSVGRRSASEC
jgi:hypothetical protein